MIKSVYIHIPFCNTICTYCDFCKFYYNEKWVSAYLKMLEHEIQSTYKKDLIQTLYIGGGTPSCLSLKELQKLFLILKQFDLSMCQEFTFECNIENLTVEKVKFLIDHGVNRLSIGVETFHPKYVKLLNRHHQKEEVKKKIQMLKQLGLSNINIDLMYALPGETIEEVKEDLEEMLLLDVPHISTYSLMIEPHTILGIQKAKPVLEETDEAMYKWIEKRLKEMGYIHYEVSNFARPSYESKHNLVYWNNLEYYGFGLGASGYVDQVRYDNTRNFHEYLKGNFQKESHIVTANEAIENEFILGFRKVEGISMDSFQCRYHRDLLTYPVIQKLLREGKLIQQNGNIKIKYSDLYISNQVLCQLIGEQYESDNQ